MGAPEGHPFYGNQYTNGGYIKGTFKYVPENLGNVADIFDIRTSQKAISQEPKQPSLIGSEPMGIVKITIIATAIAVVASAIAYLVYKQHEKKVMVQTIELNNTGICVRCGEPLSGSTYCSEGEKNDHCDFIKCKKCGKKNFAWYPDCNK